jgi:hypothetical protein
MSDNPQRTAITPIVPSRYDDEPYRFHCLDCAGEGTEDVPATWEHADEALAAMECWCDDHLPDGAVVVPDGESAGWSRPATVGRKVNSADGTSTPPRHLPPLPDECYPPGAVPIPYEPDNGSSEEE